MCIVSNCNRDLPKWLPTTQKYTKVSNKLSAYSFKQVVFVKLLNLRFDKAQYIIYQHKSATQQKLHSYSTVGYKKIISIYCFISLQFIL